MRHLLLLIGIAALAACGGDETPQSSAQTTSAAAGPASAAQAAQAPARKASSDRKGELVNPDDATVVLLYYDLAGIAPPFDAWVEEDTRVRFAAAADKAAQRQTVRAELESAAASVKSIGMLRLTMHANLSEYDPSYGEFTVRALAPSSTVEFKALQQKVSLRFANGATAQTWQVPPDQAQAIRDRIGYGSASIDVALRITGVQPSPGGGTIVTEVLRYELREDRGGTTLGRVQVAGP